MHVINSANKWIGICRQAPWPSQRATCPRPEPGGKAMAPAGKQRQPDLFFNIRSPLRAALCLLFVLACAGGSLPVAADTPAGAFSRLQVVRPKRILPAPDFGLTNLAGQSVRLSDYRGRLVLLNFWATFCGPCRREMPALQALWQSYREQGLVVLALAADRGGPQTVAEFVAEGGYRFPVLLDGEGEVRKRYEVRALPTSYLIGRDGRFIGRIIGERDWDSAAARQLIASLLE
ncbi:MAG TPA: TlpA family protein disulfide reductase [Gammaproteobacteria bacterium]|nr:TlpA family protein disulfide reductase [Gammaproteobacteria bacterium]